jgi:CubicO group peptidase (beta-lactamase class C family)
MVLRVTRRTVLKSILGSLAFSLPSQQCIARASSPNGGIEPSERQAMAAVAEDFVRKLDAPGLSVAIAYDGRLVYEEAFGFTGRNSRERLTTSHLFRIASVSKPITSAAIFGLIEKGRLRSEDRVFGRYGILGTKYGSPPYGHGVEQITIDQLLTHTSGGWSNLTNDPMFLNIGLDQAELISWALDNQPLSNPPGKVFAYSNFGYCILGRVIEKVTGQPYAEYVRSAILLPSGITDMRIAENTLQKRAEREVTYYGQGQGPYEDPYAINVRRMDSHGGWIATPVDLVRFAMHVDGFDRSRNILSPETIRKMATSTAANGRYARGWNVNEKGHWWHGGDLAGTTAVLVRTSSRFCWAGLTNTRRAQSAEAIDDMMWDLAGKVSAWRNALA